MFNYQCMLLKFGFYLDDLGLALVDKATLVKERSHDHKVGC